MIARFHLTTTAAFAFLENVSMAAMYVCSPIFQICIIMLSAQLNGLGPPGIWEEYCSASPCWIAIKEISQNSCNSNTYRGRNTCLNASGK